MNKIAITAIVLLSLLAARCFQSRHLLVRVCHPSERLLHEASAKYADHTPLTAGDLRRYLADDTSHYKILIVYSYCCAGCKEAMRDTYLPLMRGMGASTTWAKLLNECGL